MELRAHHLLCLLGFRGLGYSPEFVANLSRLCSALRSRPDTPVTVADTADDVCRACPRKDACADPAGSPAERDRALLAHLRTGAGDSLPWQAWLDRIAAAVDEPARARVCSGCRWDSLGYCREGLETLRAGRWRPAGAEL